MRSFLFFSPCFLGMPGLRERRIAGGCSRISLRLFGVWDGGQYAFACRVRAGGEVGEDVVLFGVFAFVGGGRGVISYSTPPPRPGPPFPQVCPVAPTLAGGAAKEGTLAASGKTGLPPPRPLHRGVYKRGCRSFLGVPRPPPLALTDNRRPLFPTSLPPPSLPDRLGRRHLLVYPVPGLRRGHQSRKQRAGRAGPDCPARGGPERGSGAGLRGPWKPRGLPPVPFPRRPRCYPPERGSGTWAPSTSCA